MGGHGGLNILPQKTWNVYRHDRQYQVKFDEHRDIEKKLNDKERLKRERLSDSLVELRRKAQDSQNRDLDPEFDKRKPSSRRQSKRETPGHEQDSDDGERPEAIVDAAPEKKANGHINFFENEEREAEEQRNRRREHLIKSGHYVYNANAKGPRKVNVFVDDENAKVTPDFKKQETPWYMKPKSNIKHYSETVNKRKIDLDGLSAPESGRKKHRKTTEELRSERLSRESSERARALALLKSK